MGELDERAWPAWRLGEALEVLARRRGVAPQPAEAAVPPTGLATDEALGHWMRAAAGCLGLEAEPVEVAYPEVEALVRDVGPALLRLPGAGEPRFFVLLDGRRRAVRLLGPDLTVSRHPPAAGVRHARPICCALC